MSTKRVSSFFALSILSLGCLLGLQAPGYSQQSASTLTINNQSKNTVEVFWVNFQGKETSYGKIKPGVVAIQRSFRGHTWVIRAVGTGQVVGRITLNRPTHEIKLGGNPKDGNNNRAELVLQNAGKAPVNVYWVDFKGKEVFYFSLKPGASQKFVTGIQHQWVVRNPANNAEVSRITVKRPAERYVVAVANAPAVVVPNLVTLSRANAEAALRKLGLNPKAEEGSQARDAKQVGLVSSQNPAPNTKVKVGSTISFTYYKAKASVVPATVRVPSLQNLSRAEADQAIRKAGLVPRGFEGTANADKTKVGKVFYQEPKANVTAKSGSAVSYFYYKAANPPLVTTVAVPSLINQAKTTAEQALKSAKLVPSSVAGSQIADARKVGLVYEQTPPANARVAPGTTVTLRYYTARPGPGPIDATSKDPIPNIAPLATPDDTIFIAWKRVDGKTFVSQYSGNQWKTARHNEIGNALSMIAGLARDEKGNLYLATMRKEQANAAEWAQKNRPNVAQILKIAPGKSSATLLVDFNKAGFSRLPIVNPLNYAVNAFHTSRLAYGNGKLAIAFAHNNGAFGNVHLTSSVLAVGTDGKSLYSNGGSMHSADVRLLFDGKNFIMAQVFEAGIGLSQLSGNDKMTWTDQILAFKNPRQKVNGSGGLRLGGIAGTSDGYLVLCVHGDGWMWNYNKSETLKAGATIAVVKAPANFASFTKFDWEKAPNSPAGFRTTVLASPPAGKSNIRPRIIDLKNGKYVVIWERWGGDPQWLGKYENTMALVMDGNGRILVAPKVIGTVRIQKCAEAFLLPRSRKAAWVSGDSANGQLMLHTLDESLKLAYFPLSVR